MFSRNVLNALWPEGAFWQPEQDSDYDNLLEGVALNTEKVRLDMEKLRYLRDPAKTPILSDLEKEYSVIPATGATEAERRSRLATVMFRRGELPTYTRMEEKLQAAGFNVQVHVNSPRTDPRRYFDQFFTMTAGGLLPGGNDAQCGEPAAQCAHDGGGELLVNGDFFQQLPNYTALCGEPDVQCGDVYAGEFDSIQIIPILYNVPSNPGYWPMIFFVGGAAIIGASGSWYLPSKNELNLMYTNLHLLGKGNFRDSEYWSSTEATASTAWRQDFYTGAQDAHGKLATELVRPYQINVEPPGSYSIGDPYTSASTVFHVDGSDVYVCLNFDLWSGTYQWSDSYGLVGTTLPDIGSGQANTIDVIAATTESAAKKCQSYDSGGLIIDTADVPAQRREEFRRIILRYKPMAAWAALVVSYV